MAEPRRGEVWIVDLGFAAKSRPCLVLSVGAADSDRALATIVPHTTSVRGTRFEASVGARFLRRGAFDCQNLLSVPHAKLIRRIGALAETDMATVVRVVADWLGIRYSG